MFRHLKIYVVGPTASGKSTVSKLIQKMLESYGIEVEYKDVDAEFTNSLSEEELDKRVLMMGECGTTTQVETVTTNRHGRASIEVT